MALPSDTVLNDRYTIQYTPGEAAAFAVAYVAHDREEDQEVVVTEYFPPHLAERSGNGQVLPREGKEASFEQGLKYFKKEAGVLRGIEHANLTREIEDFEARGTVYRVSEHREGASLTTALEKNDGSISEKAALTVMKPVLGALHALHREGLLHGGLSPEAIYLTNSRKVLLRGFRSAQLQLARKTDALEDVVIAGMSPPEQYDPDGRQGPWTDVYAAAATFYRAVTGETLPEARSGPLEEETLAEHLDGADAISDDLKDVLKRALAPRPRGRFQSAHAFQEMLDNPALLGDATDEGTEDEGTEDASAGAAGTFAGTAAGITAGMEASSDDDDGDSELTVWGPASMAAAAAEAAKIDKEKAREERAARGDRPAEPGRDEESENGAGVLPVSNRVAMGGGAALLVLLLVGAGFLFTDLLGGGESNAEGSSNASYARLVAEGDSLYENENLQAAGERYEQAQEMAPEDASGSERVTDRLFMIDRLQDAMTKQNYQRDMSRGDSLMARAGRRASGGEDAQAQVLYEQAGEAYFAALKSRENDSLARTRVQAVNNVLEGDDAEGQDGETTLEEERERLFTRYRDQGDEALESEDYETARRKFREALEYRSGDTYVLNRLDQIGERISASEQQAQYRRYRSRADSLFAAGQLEGARNEYRLVLDVRPDDAAAAGRVSTIDERLAQRRENQQQYQSHRARGDVHFDDGELTKAVASYEQALQYRPEDEYVQGRVRTIQERVVAAEKAEEEEQAQARRQANKTENGIYTVVDEQPKIVGGRSSLVQNISYPSRARRSGIEGRVYLRVTVGADGSVQNVEVTRGIGYGADQEAKSAVRATEFEPALVDGEPVPAFTSLFIPFRLQ